MDDDRDNGSNEMPDLDRQIDNTTDTELFGRQAQGLNPEDDEDDEDKLRHSGTNTSEEPGAFGIELERQDSTKGGYTGSYEGGNVAAMYKQFNGQMTAIIEAAFVLILLVLIYYLYNGKVVSYNMKVAACVVGGVYFLNEFLVYQGKSGGVVGMMGNVMGRA
jgi:hypothetical protein